MPSIFITGSNPYGYSVGSTVNVTDSVALAALADSALGGGWAKLSSVSLVPPVTPQEIARQKTVFQNGPLARLINAALASSGAGLATHPTITATFSQGLAGQYPTGDDGVEIMALPNGFLGRNATAADPSVLTTPVLGPTPMLGSGASTYGPTFGGSQNTSNGNSYNFPVYSSAGTPMGFSYILNNRKFWVQTLSTTPILVLVDDQLVGIFTPNGSLGWVKVDLGVFVNNKVTVITSALSAIGTDSFGTISPVALPPLIAAIGDSYLGQATAQVGITFGLGLQMMSRAFGSTNVIFDAEAGTGYLNTVGGATITARARLPQIMATNPQGLVVPMGVNDAQNSPTLAALQAEILLFFSQARALGPNCVLIGMDPFCPDESQAYSGKFSGIGAAVLAALRADKSGPWIYISNLTNYWETSAGTKSTQVSSGSSYSNVAAGNANFPYPNGRSWQTGKGGGITLASAPSSGATTATLASAWTGSTTSAVMTFSNGDVRAVTLTNGQTTLGTFTALSSAATVNAGYYLSGFPGNCGTDLSADLLHPSAVGGDRLAQRFGAAVRAALLSMRL